LGKKKIHHLMSCKNKFFITINKNEIKKLKNIVLISFFIKKYAKIESINIKINSRKIKI